MVLGKDNQLLIIYLWCSPEKFDELNIEVKKMYQLDAYNFIMI